MMPYSHSIFLTYLEWHYSRGIREVGYTIGNFLWFITHFFSFRLLLSTLVSPWKRMGESYGRVFSLGAFLSTFVVNSLMRIVGLIVRSVVLIIGLIMYLFTIALGGVVFVVWLSAPIVMVACIVLSATFFLI